MAVAEPRDPRVARRRVERRRARAPARASRRARARARPSRPGAPSRRPSLLPRVSTARPSPAHERSHERRTSRDSTCTSGRPAGQELEEALADDPAGALAEACDFVDRRADELVVAYERRARRRRLERRVGRGAGDRRPRSSAASASIPADVGSAVDEPARSVRGRVCEPRLSESSAQARRARAPARAPRRCRRAAPARPSSRSTSST